MSVINIALIVFGCLVGRAIASSSGLNSRYFCSISVIPPRFQPLVLDANLDGLVRLQQVQRDAAQDREVLRRVALAHPRLVLSIGDIQSPVQAVFDAPVPAHDLPHALGIGLEGTDVIAPLSA